MTPNVITRANTSSAIGVGIAGALIGFVTMSILNGRKALAYSLDDDSRVRQVTQDAIENFWNNAADNHAYTRATPEHRKAIDDYIGLQAYLRHFGRVRLAILTPVVYWRLEEEAFYASLEIEKLGYSAAIIEEWALHETS